MIHHPPKKNLLLFDVDGTICESGKQISDEMAHLIQSFSNHDFDIGIVGGGTFEKISYQLNSKLTTTHFFSECGSVYHLLLPSNSFQQIYQHNIQTLPYYPQLIIIVKEALKYLSGVDYGLAGHFIDRRNGLIYISLVGMSATDEERTNFMMVDNQRHYRKELLHLLQRKSKELNIDDQIEITLGGSVGIALLPRAWNKTQVVPHLQDLYEDIYYFGDKYEEHGNDHNLIHHSRIIGVKVDSLSDTKEKLLKIFLKKFI